MWIPYKHTDDSKTHVPRVKFHFLLHHLDLVLLDVLVLVQMFERHAARCVVYDRIRTRPSPTTRGAGSVGWNRTIEPARGLTDVGPPPTLRGETGRDTDHDG